MVTSSTLVAADACVHFTEAGKQSHHHQHRASSGRRVHQALAAGVEIRESPAAGGSAPEGPGDGRIVGRGTAGPATTQSSIRASPSLNSLSWLGHLGSMPTSPRLPSEAAPVDCSYTPKKVPDAGIPEQVDASHGIKRSAPGSDVSVSARVAPTHWPGEGGPEVELLSASEDPISMLAAAGHDRLLSSIPQPGRPKFGGWDAEALSAPAGRSLHSGRPTGGVANTRAAASTVAAMPKGGVSRGGSSLSLTNYQGKPSSLPSATPVSGTRHTSGSASSGAVDRPVPALAAQPALPMQVLSGKDGFGLAPLKTTIDPPLLADPIVFRSTAHSQPAQLPLPGVVPALGCSSDSVALMESCLQPYALPDAAPALVGPNDLAYGLHRPASTGQLNGWGGADVSGWATPHGPPRPVMVPMAAGPPPPPPRAPPLPAWSNLQRQGSYQVCMLAWLVLDMSGRLSVCMGPLSVCMGPLSFEFLSPPLA